ncbi:PaaI family thioesterase [Pontibacter harenae]|uniref:PaaI family thioesterase n=1 Tax=Pontibacter harenae TaxID=2894083 RepID=UPI001E289982|nr:PaaI family thioesterase [Pontibacter harenae]MCC9165575.1 PaaI family thioesterase [Pontibacter harenae]
MIQTHNPDFKEDVLEKILRQNFANLIDFIPTLVEAGRIEGEVVLEDKHRQNKGFAHGGFIASVADIVAGFAAVTLVPKDHHVVTAEIKVSYFSPGVGENIGKGYVIKSGRKLNFCEAEIYVVKGEQEPKLIAKATATMATVVPEDAVKRHKTQDTIPET